jgi:hypothetical protein
MSENVKLSLIWGTVVVLGLAILIGFPLVYNQHKNELIAQAKTCEQALIIDGLNGASGDYMRIRLCKGEKDKP